jgi:hypothetical protein
MYRTSRGLVYRHQDGARILPSITGKSSPKSKAFGNHCCFAREPHTITRRVPHKDASCSLGA